MNNYVIKKKNNVLKWLHDYKHVNNVYKTPNRL